MHRLRPKTKSTFSVDFVAFRGETWYNRRAVNMIVEGIIKHVE